MSQSGQPRRPIVTALVAGLTMTTFLLAACSGLPPLEEQKARIHNRNFELDKLTPQAFVETWGEAPYRYEASVQYFPLKNGQYMPDFRVPLGEVPVGWNSTLAYGPSLFLAYPDQGELVGFMEDRLVYREALPAEELHAIGKAWKHERKFKTTIETGTAKPR